MRATIFTSATVLSKCNGGQNYFDAKQFLHVQLFLSQRFFSVANFCSSFAKEFAGGEMRKLAQIDAWPINSPITSSETNYQSADKCDLYKGMLLVSKPYKDYSLGKGEVCLYRSCHLKYCVYGGGEILGRSAT